MPFNLLSRAVLAFGTLAVISLPAFADNVAPAPLPPTTIDPGSLTSTDKPGAVAPNPVNKPTVKKKHHHHKHKTTHKIDNNNDANRKAPSPPPPS